MSVGYAKSMEYINDRSVDVMHEKKQNKNKTKNQPSPYLPPLSSCSWWVSRASEPAWASSGAAQRSRSSTKATCFTSPRTWWATASSATTVSTAWPAWMTGKPSGYLPLPKWWSTVPSTCSRKCVLFWCFAVLSSIVLRRNGWRSRVFLFFSLHCVPNSPVFPWQILKSLFFQGSLRCLLIIGYICFFQS